jgi:hypothetical protein
MQLLGCYSVVNRRTTSGTWQNEDKIRLNTTMFRFIHTPHHWTLRHKQDLFYYVPFYTHTAALDLTTQTRPVLLCSVLYTHRSTGPYDTNRTCFTMFRFIHTPQHWTLPHKQDLFYYVPFYTHTAALDLTTQTGPVLLCSVLYTHRSTGPYDTNRTYFT